MSFTLQDVEKLNTTLKQLFTDSKDALHQLPLILGRELSKLQAGTELWKFLSVEGTDLQRINTKPAEINPLGCCTLPPNQNFALQVNIAALTKMAFFGDEYKPTAESLQVETAVGLLLTASTCPAITNALSGATVTLVEIINHLNYVYKQINNDNPEIAKAFLTEYNLFRPKIPSIRVQLDRDAETLPFDIKKGAGSSFTTACYPAGIEEAIAKCKKNAYALFHDDSKVAHLIQERLFNNSVLQINNYIFTFNFYRQGELVDNLLKYLPAALGDLGRYLNVYIDNSNTVTRLDRARQYVGKNIFANRQSEELLEISQQCADTEDFLDYFKAFTAEARLLAGAPGETIPVLPAEFQTAEYKLQIVRDDARESSRMKETADDLYNNAILTNELFMKGLIKICSELNEESLENFAKFVKNDHFVKSVLSLSFGKSKDDISLNFKDGYSAYFDQMSKFNIATRLLAQKLYELKNQSVATESLVKQADCLSDHPCFSATANARGHGGGYQH